MSQRPIYSILSLDLTPRRVGSINRRDTWTVARASRIALGSSRPDLHRRRTQGWRRNHSEPTATRGERFLSRRCSSGRSAPSAPSSSRGATVTTPARCRNRVDHLPARRRAWLHHRLLAQRAPRPVHDDAETVAAVVAGALDWHGDPRRRACPGRPAHPPPRVAREPARPLAGGRASAARQVSGRRVAPGDEGSERSGALRGRLHPDHLRPDAAAGDRLAARLTSPGGRAPRGAPTPARRPGAPRPRSHHGNAAGAARRWPWPGAAG